MDSSSAQQQLELGLDDARVEVPWGGRSPRVLTAAYKRFILKAQAGKRMAEFVNPAQYNLWPSKEKAPRISRGAPLLFEPRRE